MSLGGRRSRRTQGGKLLTTTTGLVGLDLKNKCQAVKKHQGLSLTDASCPCVFSKKMSSAPFSSSFSSSPSSNGLSATTGFQLGPSLTRLRAVGREATRDTP